MGRWGFLTCKARLHLDLLDFRVSWSRSKLLITITIAIRAHH